MHYPRLLLSDGRATICAFGLLLSCGVCGGGESDLESNLSSHRDSASRWSFSTGFAWRQMGKLRFDAGQRSSIFALPNLLSTPSLNDPAIGSLDGFASRQYDNGFVRPSAFTEATGLTSFWSYQDASQVDATAITFDATGLRTEFAASGPVVRNFRDSESLEAVFPQFDLIFRPDRNLFGSRNFDGFLFSLSFGGSDDTTRYSNFSSGQELQTFTRSFSDTFALGGLAGNVPPAGFVGTFEGPGALIPNIPSNRQFNENLSQIETASIANAVETKADLDALSLAFGPTFTGTISNEWFWQLSAGATLTLYDWDTSQSETLSAEVGGSRQILNRYRDTDSGTAISLGAYLRATVAYRLTSEWFVNSSLQAETATSIDLDAGASSYDFDPGGFSIGLGVGRNF